jgi:hypothetical protein
MLANASLRMRCLTWNRNAGQNLECDAYLAEHEDSNDDVYHPLRCEWRGEPSPDLQNLNIRAEITLKKVSV